MRPSRRLCHPVCHDMSKHDEQDEEDDEKGPCSLGTNAKSRFGFSRGFGPSAIGILSTSKRTE